MEILTNRGEIHLTIIAFDKERLKDVFFCWERLEMF